MKNLTNIALRIVLIVILAACNLKRSLSLRVA